MNKILLKEFCLEDKKEGLGYVDNYYFKADIKQAIILDLENVMLLYNGEISLGEYLSRRTKLFGESLSK